MKITEVTKKDGSIIYRANIYLGTDAITGKKVKTSVTGRTKKEVRQKAKKAALDFAREGTRYKTADVTVKNFKELSELWLETYQLTVKPQTYRITLTWLNVHVLPKIGQIKIENINAPIIQKLVNDLSKKLTQFGTVKSVISRVLQFGVTLQIIKYNPARDVMLPRGKAKQEKVKFIEPDHLKRFLEHTQKLSHKDFTRFSQYTVFKLLLATGCRIGELSALEWSDIDFKKNTISITKSYNQEIKEVGETKTKSGRRQISIDKNTMLLLKQYQNRQRLVFLEVGSTPKVIFSTPNRPYIPRNAWQSIIDERCKDCGIPRFTFHAFRHTHASLLLNAGISYKELQYRLGHANISMTLDIYSHLSKDKERESVTYFEKAINSL